MSHATSHLNNNSWEVDEETGEVFFRRPSRSKSNVRRSKSPPPFPLSPLDRRSRSRSRSRSKSPSKSPESCAEEKCDPYTAAVRKAIVKRTPRRTPSPRVAQSPRTTSRSARKTKDSWAPKSIKDLPNNVLRQVFGYLDIPVLKVCARVCRQWKSLTDMSLSGPCVFQGKSVYGHYYSFERCRNFVEFLLDLEPRFERPVEIRLMCMSNSQARLIVDKHEAHFKVAVRHMECLRFVNCSLHWKILMALFKCFSKQLRMLSDNNSIHYSQQPICWRQHGQQMKKEVDREEFKYFKDQLKGLRKLSITRKTITNELPIYLCILAQGTRNLYELEINLGPYETPNASSDTRFSNLLNLFVKELQGLLYKNQDTLKVIRFSWRDSNFTGYFNTCIDVLEKMHLNELQAVTLHFDKHAMRGKGVSALQHFLQYHYSRRLRCFKLDRMELTENWTSTAEFLDELMETIPPSVAGLDMKILISDSNGTIKMAPVHQILRLEVFRNFITDIYFCVENEATKSISQMFGKEWHKRNNYPMVKSVVVTFEPISPMKPYKQFTSFDIDLISNLFPNLTQLKISDKLGEHNQIFTPVIGRKLVSGVSCAQLENKDIQLIAKHLRKLKILRLWVNMSTVDDHGITGIHRGDISILHEEDEYFTWENFHNAVLPSFSKLHFLEELSLRGLGPAVTDISLKFGFKNLFRLRLLELCGKMSVTKQGKQDFRRIIKSNVESQTKVRIERRVI